MLGLFTRPSRTLEGVTVALEQLTNAVTALIHNSENEGGLAARVDALERTLERRDAQTRALLEEVDARFRSVRASEERTRRMTRALEEEDEGPFEGDEESSEGLEEYARILQESHAAGGEEEGVHPMRGGVETHAETKHRLRLQKLGFL